MSMRFFLKTIKQKFKSLDHNSLQTKSSHYSKGKWDRFQSFCPKLPLNFMLNSSRTLRTGFFRTDEDFIDPEDPLFAYSENEWKFADDPTLKSSVLERDNVGMGMVILNRENGLNLRLVNTLYRKLRDLEVNSLKRYCLITSFNRKHYMKGLDLMDILLLAEYSQSTGELSQTAVKYVKNLQDLNWCIHTYYKPLISFLNGYSDDSGGSLVFLANRSAAYEHSEFLCLFPRYGWVPVGGLSFVLSSLRGSLGLYIALTGHKLCGEDLVHSGLCSHWMSPEAFHFMELTSEKQLEVSENDAKILLEEHFLMPKKSLSEYSLYGFEKLIHECFNKASLIDVIEDLKEKSNPLLNNESSHSDIVVHWARETLKKIGFLDPVSAHITFKLIRDLQSFRYNLLKDAGITPYEYFGMQRLRYTVPRNVRESSLNQLWIALNEECLHQSLKLETRIAHRIFMRSELPKRLKSIILNQIDDSHVIDFKNFYSITKSEIQQFFEPLKDKGLEFSVIERTEHSYSLDPRIKTVHPDYNPETKLEYDPIFMANELHRWSDDYLQAELSEMRKYLC